MTPAVAQTATAVQSGSRAPYDFPSQPLTSALTALAQKSGLKLAYNASLTQGRTAPALRGSYTFAQALSRLLQGSGLTYRFTSANTATIIDVNALERGAGIEGATNLGPIDVQAAGNSVTTEGSNSYVSNSASISKDGATIKQTPQSVSVVTRKRASLDSGLQSAVRGRFVGTLQSQEFIEDGAYRRLGQFYGVLEGDLSDSTTARVGAYYQQTPARQPWSGVPATTQYKFADVPRSTFVGAPWNKNIYTQTGAFTELDHKFDNGWATKASLNYIRYQSDITSSNFLGQLNPTTLTGTFASTHWKQDDQQVGFDWFASGPVYAFGREHKLTFGVNATHDDLGQTNFYGPNSNRFYLLPGQSIFDLNIPRPAFDGPVFDRHTYTDQFSAYANARIKLADPLTLVVGGRLLWWDSRFDPVPSPDFANQKPDA